MEVVSKMRTEMVCSYSSGWVVRVDMESAEVLMDLVDRLEAAS